MTSGKTMNLSKLIFVSACVFLSVSLTAQIKSPEEHYGFKPGSDGNLFLYEELIEYLQILDEASDKVKMQQIGKSPEGRPMYIAFISSAENLDNLDKLKEYNRKLSMDPDLPESEKSEIFSEGKVFVLATLSMHSTEVGPSQSAPLMAYDLATTTDADKLQWLEDMVFMMVPCHNPDGMNIVINHYRKYKGTKYDGSSVPRVYHKYVGHDNNRDFVILSQEDTRAIARIYNLDWFPQVMVEKHQMGSTGVRYFVPPMHDPIAENVDAEIWNWTGVFGANMISDMTKNGQAGVTYQYLFDDYWPGSTETCLWKNVVGMLTEAASAKMATPVFVEPTELRVSGKGLSDYKKSINMPLPWEGGWWHLGDIVEYEIVSMFSILKTASLHREELLRFRNRMTESEVEKGKTQAPYYYLFPKQQHDYSEMVYVVNLLREHGVKVYTVRDDVVFANYIIEKGSIVVPMAQPFRPFIKEVLEKQEYPVRHYTPDGEIIKPYDIASWSLPLHNGVHSKEINTRIQELESQLDEITQEYSLISDKPEDAVAMIFPVTNNESFKAAFLALSKGLGVSRTTKDEEINGKSVPVGSFLIQKGQQSSAGMKEIIDMTTVSPVFLNTVPQFSTHKLSLPRIALVETNFSDMDAGWTRFIFDTYSIPFKVVKPGDFEDTDFAKSFDVIIFPGSSKSILMEGKRGSAGNYYPTSYPPEYTKGIGKDGMKNIMTFVDKGGLIISWGQSTALFEGSLQIEREKDDKEDFKLPFSDISAQLETKGLYCPGSLVKIKLIPDHPITLGMEKETGVFFRGAPVFSTSIPNFDMDRRVIGTTPEKKILMSGYIEKEELLGNKSLLLWMKKGKGQFVLFGFNPQFRASSHATYKLLFNSILLPKI